MLLTSLKLAIDPVSLRPQRTSEARFFLPFSYWFAAFPKLDVVSKSFRLFIWIVSPKMSCITRSKYVLSLWILISLSSNFFFFVPSSTSRRKRVCHQLIMGAVTNSGVEHRNKIPYHNHFLLHKHLNLEGQKAHLLQLNHSVSPCIPMRVTWEATINLYPFFFIKENRLRVCNRILVNRPKK